MKVISHHPIQKKSSRFQLRKRFFHGKKLIVATTFSSIFVRAKRVLKRRFWKRQYSHAYLQTFGVVIFVLGFVGGVGVLIYRNIAPYIFASDTTTTWDFTTAGDYTLSDTTLAEVTSNTARLKVRNYSSDANTALLLHLDESSGNPTDSSSNANTVTNNGATYSSGNFNNAADFDGTTDSLSVSDSSSISLSQSNTLEGWTKFSSAFSAGSHVQRQGMFDKGEYQLYYDNESGKIVYELADSTADSWTQVAGNDVDGSWDVNGNPNIESMVVMGTDIYVGTGNGTGDAEVWKWNGTTWSQIGGDGLNNCWAINTFETVFSLATDGTYLYAGLGSGTGDAEVWRWNGSTWTKVGGDALNSSWAINTFEYVSSLYYQGTYLYAGLGSGANDAEVWRCSGCSGGTPAWTKVGGDSINSGWTTNYEYAFSLTGDGTNLYAGLALTAGDAEVWKCTNCDTSPSWSMIGGDGTGWANSTYEYVLSMYYLGSSLYVGLGISASDAEVWRYTSGAWTQVGGDSLNSSWGAGYEGAYSLTSDGTNVYAGLGNTAGDNEVWMCSSCATSPTWTKIGGDAVDSSFSNTQTVVNAMVYTDSTLYTALITTSAAYSGQVWTYRTTDSPKWTLIGGNYVNYSWGYRGLNDVDVMNVSGEYLYAGTGYQYTGNALVWRYDGSSWSIIGGQGLNGSWAIDTFERVSSMISHKGVLFVGLGSSANDAEVWRCDNCGSSPTWTKVGGDSINSGWTTNFEEVTSLTSYGGYIFAGIGNSANDAEVWRCTGCDGETPAWTKVGGDSLYSGWTTNYEQVLALQPYQGTLFAGLGNSDGDAELWSCSTCDGTPSWSKVGGDGANSSWSSSPLDTYNNVDSLIVYNSQLIIGLGSETGEAAVWTYNGSTWTQIGGDALNGSWDAATYERVRTTVVYNGDLYAGLGNSAGDGEVWKWNGSAWTQVAGDSVNASWSSVVEEVNAFSIYKGKLYVGVGNSANVDAAIYAFGNNAVLSSTTNSQDTNWHHIAATYDGATMKLYIDGVLDNSASYSRSLPNTSHNLLIGSTYAGREFGKPQGFFQGSLDEFRISNTARSSFTTKPFATSAQTVYNSSAVYTSQVKSFDAFTTSETLNGGTITYRISSDGGTTWKYWDGGAWATSSSTSDANSASTINTNIPTFTVGTGGITWQAILSGDGTQQVSLTQVQIGAISDASAPTNPTTLTALTQAGGDAITTNTWYPNSGPYFSWTGADDGAGSGISGYYVYFGTDSGADPSTAGAFQAGSTYTASSLTSGQTYYLIIKAKDNAQNVAGSSWSPFIYKYDSTAPSNPSVISVSPAGYAASNSFTFTWPSSGASAASDAGSGVAGYQYKTGASSGTYSDWSATTASTSVSIDDIAYADGENVFYLRTIDTAGNVNGTPISTSYYFAGEGASAPQFLSATPSTNTTNSFAFSWSAPETYSGAVGAITYCYTVNTLPSAITCTFTSAGATSLSASSFATQVGLNTFYVVAKNSADSGGAINYGAYASVSFTANTAAPGIPLNADIADVSVKSTESWKLAISWEAPSDVGSGVSNYEIYRSTDNATYTKIASTTGIAYVDTRLEQTTYYYKIRACDSVNNCGAYTEAVSLLPTGKFTEAPSLSSGPTVSSITTKQATISWSTDRTADSKVQYGTSAGSYFTSEPSSSTHVTDHEIILTNLSPGTTYYYKTKWTDEDGNTGSSSEKSFTTDPAPTVTDPKAKTVGLTTASIEYTVKGASKVKIYYGKTSAFGGVTEVSTSTAETTYTTVLEDLEDGTKYFYKINGFDTENAEYEGSILTFETLPRPKISKVRIQQVKNTAQPTVLVSWTSNTATSSIVTYYPESSPGQARDEVNVTLKEGQHQIIVRGLVPQTPYVLFVKGRDKAGNEAASEAQKFTTATDTRPAQISNIKIEGSTQTGENQQSISQLVVSWNTDESATSQVEFGEGTGTVYSQKTQEDTNLTFNHLVVISGLSPSKVYHLRAVSKDTVGNISQSIDTVTITPKATENALDLVITNLQQVFGFIGGI